MPSLCRIRVLGDFHQQFFPWKNHRRKKTGRGIHTQRWAGIQNTSPLNPTKARHGGGSGNTISNSACPPIAALLMWRCGQCHRPPCAVTGCVLRPPSTVMGCMCIRISDSLCHSTSLRPPISNLVVFYRVITRVLPGTSNLGQSYGKVHSALKR